MKLAPLKYVIVLLLSLFAFAAQSSVTAKKSLMLMGCGFELSATATNEAVAWQAINEGIKEIRRIEKLISSWDPQSQTSAINASAGQYPVKVNKELYDLIYRANKVSTLTNGAFDISFASMNKLWLFNQKEQQLPESALVFAARAKINFENIVLNPFDTSVYLAEGMRIGFGAIGKGYAANQAKVLMQAVPGVLGGAVNASGDILSWGESNGNTGRKISIANPKNKMQPIAWLQVKDAAVVTSGDYEKYFTANGKRYAHIINPKTGFPSTGVSSVTVICPNAELADALATSVFVLGVKEGLALINSLASIECIIVDDAGELHQSKNLELNYY